MKFQLTWHSARKCWKKIHAGKTHYLGKGKCKAKYDMEGYHAALKEWEEIETDLTAQAKADELFETDPVILEKIALAAQHKAHWEQEYPGKTFPPLPAIGPAWRHNRELLSRIDSLLIPFHCFMFTS